MSDAAASHRAAGRGLSARCAVVTVSDTRTLADDASGRLAAELLEGAGHRVLERELVRDEPAAIEATLRRLLGDGEVDIVLTTGGTGVARRDGTVEVVERLLDRRLDGFGELFRMLSWEDVGSAAMLSRATGGLAGDVFLFALPGSPAAVRLALERLLLPELPHLLGLRRH